MIQDAEKYSDDDKKVKEKVEARNELESYTYSLKNQIGDKEKLGGKLSDEDKTTVEEAVEKSITWLDANPDADTEEMKEQKKTLEEAVQPIISKIYQGQAPPEGEGGEAPEDEDAGDHDEL